MEKTLVWASIHELTCNKAHAGESVTYAFIAFFTAVDKLNQAAVWQYVYIFSTTKLWLLDVFLVHYQGCVQYQQSRKMFEHLGSLPKHCTYRIDRRLSHMAEFICTLLQGTSHQTNELQTILQTCCSTQKL